MHAGVGGGHRLEHGFFHGEVRQVRRRDQRLMFLHRGGDDVDVGFQARADAFVRLAITGAAVEREVLRQRRAAACDRAPGGLRRRVRRRRPGRRRRLRGDVRIRTGRGSARRERRMPPMPTVTRFDRNLRAPLGIGHGGANGFGDGVLIGDAALGPSRRGREAVAR